MDFIISVMLIIIGILLLINFTTISISDNKFGNSNCSMLPNYLFSTMQNNQLQKIPTLVSATSQSNSITANNNSEYNYIKYFFVK